MFAAKGTGVKPRRLLRVVLATVGSRGNIQPMLALGQRLLAQGIGPVIAAPPKQGHFYLPSRRRTGAGSYSLIISTFATR
jgi:hypothetical protein